MKMFLNSQKLTEKPVLSEGTWLRSYVNDTLKIPVQPIKAFVFPNALNSLVVISQPQPGSIHLNGDFVEQPAFDFVIS